MTTEIFQTRTVVSGTVPVVPAGQTFLKAAGLLTLDLNVGDIVSVAGTTQLNKAVNAGTVTTCRFLKASSHPDNLNPAEGFLIDRAMGKTFGADEKYTLLSGAGNFQADATGPLTVMIVVYANAGVGVPDLTVPYVDLQAVVTRS